MKSHGNNLDVALIRMVAIDWNKVERFEKKKIETSERRCCCARSSPSPTSFRNEAIPQLLGIVSSQLIAYLEIAFQKRATSPKVMTCSVVNLHPMNGQCRIVQSWIFVTHKQQLEHSHCFRMSCKLCMTNVIKTVFLDKISASLMDTLLNE